MARGRQLRFTSIFTREARLPRRGAHDLDEAVGFVVDYLRMARLPVVDEETCIGCGTCVVIAEKTFVLKNDKAKVIIPPGDDEKTIQEAMDSCAVDSISWKS